MKYNSLLKGLEINVLNLSEVIEANQSGRIDSTFFIKETVLLDSKIKALPHFFLKKKSVVSGPFGSTLKSHSYLSEGVPFVRIENIKGGFQILKNDIVYISEIDNNRLKNSQLFLDDLVLSKVGNSIGYYARVDESINYCNISENNLGIKLSSYPRETRHFILTYLNSGVGKKLTLRRVSGNAQPKLNVFDIAEIPIPITSGKFEQIVSQSICRSLELSKKSNDIYHQTNTLLLKTLGLANFKPEEEATNIKSFSDSFKKSGRLDAEYYQLKYERVVFEIKKHKHYSLNTLVDMSKSIEPGSNVYSEEGLPFVRVADYSKQGITKPQKCLNKSYVNENKSKLDELKPKKGTILFSKDGSVGTAYHLTEDFNGITSSAILHLKVKDSKATEVIPEYLALVLNSDLVKMQAERDAGGSIILHWRVSEIKDVIVPIIDFDIQEQIADLINQSFDLKKQSEQLLEAAKRAVEIAIEDSEEVAMNYINEQM